MNRRAALGLVGVLATVAAACGNGSSILTAGNEEVATTAAPVTVPGQTTLPPASTVPPTTTTTPLDQLPPCPVEALAAASGPIEVVFWHGLNGVNETSIIALTEAYNASQDKVRVVVQNQGGYEQTIGKYLQSSQPARPDLVQMPEYMVQGMRDTESNIPIQACIEADGYDTSTFLPRALGAYSTEGITWAMPFNVSDPVLFYNRKIFAAAGLDPDDPPTSLEEVRAASEAIVASGAASTGIALDSGSDSGGGWFLEQWFAKAGELYADNGNGRLAPATRVLFDGPTGVELLTYLQDLLNDGLAVNVGDNASGQDNFLKLAAADPAAMTIGTSAAIGQVLDVVSQGLFPNIALEDLGIGPMPGPGGTLGSLVGGASLWLVADRDPAVTAAAWDYVKFLVSAQSQSTWATQTGYVPVRSDALDLDPVKTTFAEDPRFAVAYEQLLAAADDPSAVGPVLGPLREVRTVAATMIATVFGGADPATALAAGAAQANALIADYAARN